MSWPFSTDKPIFQQIVDIISTDIISGKYQPGQKLETVRELALMAGVNPNTMQRALTQIEENGLIYTRRGDGRYVSDDKDRTQSAKDTIIQKEVSSFVISLRAKGLSDKYILSFVEKELASKEENL